MGDERRTAEGAEDLSAEITPSEKKSMLEIISLAQRIFVRAVVNTGDLCGVTSGIGHKDKVATIEATRILHTQEAERAIDAASTFFRVQAAWMKTFAEAKRAAEAAPAEPKP